MHFKCKKCVHLTRHKKIKCTICEEIFAPELNSRNENKDNKNFKCYYCEVSLAKKETFRGTKNAKNLMKFKRIEFRFNSHNENIHTIQSIQK